MAENLEFRLKVIEDKLTEALDRNEKKAKSLGDVLTVAVGSFAADAAIKGISLLSDGFESLVGFVEDSVRASAESEVALKSLQIALAQTGQLTDENVESFTNLARSIQEITSFEDDAVVSSTALIQTMARLDKEGLQRATKAAVDLAAAFNIDLEAASRLVGKAAEGNITSLKKLGVEVNKGRDDAETFANTLTVLEARFGGAAKAQAQTFTGSLNQLKNVFGELQENIGNVITQNPAVIAAFTSIKNVLVSLSNSVSEAFGSNQNDNVKEFFLGILDGANAIVLSMDAVISVFTLAADVIVASIRIIAVAMVAPVAAIFEIIKHVPGIGEAFKGMADSALAEMNRLSNGINDNVKSIQNVFNGETALAELSSKIADVRNDFVLLNEEVKTKGPELKNNLNITPTVQSEDTLNKLRELNIALLEQQQTFEVEKQRIQAENDILDQERFFARSAEQITELANFELQKSDLQYQAAVDRAALLATVEERDAARQKALQDKQLRDLKIDNQKRADIRKQDLANRETFLNTAASLQSSGNKTLAAIGKSAALAQIAIETPRAAIASFRYGATIGGPPLGAAFAAIAVAAGAAQAAKVASVQGFAGGGVIGATNGPDNQVATVRTGEIVLNAQQQKNLFDAINGGNLGGGDIVIQVDGREIARAVRTQIKSGFVLA